MEKMDETETEGTDDAMIGEDYIAKASRAVGGLIPEDFSKLTDGIPKPGPDEAILITGDYMARLPLKDMEEKKSSTRLKIILKGNEADEDE